MIRLCPPDKGGRELCHDPLIRGSAVVLFLALLFPLLAWTADIPPLKSRVADLTGTLTEQQRSALEQTLAEFEARKGAQIAVLMVPTTQPEAIEQYAVRVQESWKLGRKGVDDGLLLVVAKNDRKVKIEVGYGLEGILPDAVAKRIIENDIVPRFKEGDFYGGIRAGVDRMMRIIEGEKLPPPAAHGPAAQGVPLELIVMFVVLALIGGTVLRNLFGRFFGAGLVGGIAGVAAWAVIGTLVAGLIVGLVSFLFLLLGGQGGPRGWSNGRGGWGGGWSSGGLGGGSWGGGGGDGGGFSGGGGSSGGGGASGSW